MMNLLSKLLSKKNERKEVRKRYASMFTLLALYDLDVYKATGEKMYLERAMEILNDITEDTAPKGCALND